MTIFSFRMILSYYEFLLSLFVGKYFLADAGFPIRKNFITPFRGYPYWLNDIRGRDPRCKEELFNQRHSSLRNAIERAFGLLKKRFRIIVDEPFYPYLTQVKLVLACCIIHNYLRGVMSNDPLLEEVDRDLFTQSFGEIDDIDATSRAEDAREGKSIRTYIMDQMWADHVDGRHDS